MIFAHGSGPGHDLPVPLFYALGAGVFAVFVSFLAVAVLWPASRLTGSAAGRPAPAWLERLVDSGAFRRTLQALVLIVTVSLLVQSLRLPDDPHINPASSAVYATFWVGLFVVSLLFGPVWRVVNPLRFVFEAAARLFSRDPATGSITLPAWVGYWPAALGLVAFAWLELVSPTAMSVSTILTFFGIYAAVQLAGAAVFGSSWFSRCDTFEVLSDLSGRLSPFGRRSDRRLVVRSPLNGLDSLHAESGLSAVVCVLLATTAFDSLRTVWQSESTVSATLGLLAVIVAVFLAYAACAIAGARIADVKAAGMPGAFAHSLIPIALGYVVAHYISYLVGESPRALILALETDWAYDDSPIPAGPLAVIQVLAIITGHVLGVVAAHDRAVRLFPRAKAVSGQVPMMVLMVVLTISGLALLAAD